MHFDVLIDCLTAGGKLLIPCLRVMKVDAWKAISRVAMPLHETHHVMIDDDLSSIVCAVSLI